MEKIRKDDYVLLETQQEIVFHKKPSGRIKKWLWKIPNGNNWIFRYQLKQQKIWYEKREM